MPVYLFPANITIDKAAVAENFTGGTDDFRHAFFTGAEAHNQEDNELFSISRMNVDEFDLNYSLTMASTMTKPISTQMISLCT